MPRKPSAESEKLKRDGVHISAIDCTVPGVYLYEATHLDFPLPVGSSYVRLTGNNMVEILFLFTLPHCRGDGVANSIVKHIQKDYPNSTLITCGGTNMGKPFMRATGWVEQDPYGWVYTKENDRKNRSKRKSGK